MKIWIVEKFDYGECADSEPGALGIFSTREKAEKLVARKFPEWKQSFTSAYQSMYEPPGDYQTLTVSVYSMVLDSEDE